MFHDLDPRVSSITSAGICAIFRLAAQDGLVSSNPAEL
jgi:hypothetical protein